MCCIAALSFSSCSKDYVGSERNLRGKWELYREEMHYVKDCKDYDGVEHKAGDVVVDDRTAYKEYWTFKKGGVFIFEEVGVLVKPFFLTASFILMKPSSAI